MNKIRVSIRPHVYQGLAGYRVRWVEDGRCRAYFVQTMLDARYVRRRAKEGKPFRQAAWAVKA